MQHLGPAAAAGGAFAPRPGRVGRSTAHGAAPNAPLPPSAHLCHDLHKAVRHKDHAQRALGAGRVHLEAQPQDALLVEAAELAVNFIDGRGHL